MRQVLVLWYRQATGRGCIWHKGEEGLFLENGYCVSYDAILLPPIWFFWPQYTRMMFAREIKCSRQQLVSGFHSMRKETVFYWGFVCFFFLLDNRNTFITFMIGLLSNKSRKKTIKFSLLLQVKLIQKNFWGQEFRSFVVLLKCSHIRIFGVAFKCQLSGLNTISQRRRIWAP